MDAITAVLAMCIVLLTVLYSKTRRPSSYPPGPPTLPFIGNLYIDMRNLMGVFRQYRKQYGDIFSLILGKQTLVVVNGTEAAYEVFGKHGQATSDRPEVFFFTDIGRGFGRQRSFVFNNAHLHRIMRKIGRDLTQSYGKSPYTDRKKAT